MPEPTTIEAKTRVRHLFVIVGIMLQRNWLQLAYKTVFFFFFYINQIFIETQYTVLVQQYRKRINVHCYN